MPARIGIIGYGEAGRAFGAGLAKAGATVAAYDILVPTPDGAAIRANAAADGVAVRATAREAIDGAAIVLSLVPADEARSVAAEAAGHLRAGQLFMDMNSVSPREKETGAAIVEASGARYVEATIMAPVVENGVASEVLLAGPAAPGALRLLRPLGMVLSVVGDRFGAAAAVKLCRSVIVKGIEAIVVESMLAARQYGADGAVLASLQKSDPEIDWAARADYVFERVLRHGRRRAAEMRFAGEAVSDAGYPPLLSDAIATLQDAMADYAAADRALFALADYREAADRIGALLAENEGKTRAVSR
ncbi:MAG: DUF1932 domain-containing protein [Rhodospirillaceae bacterium]|nr:DUF1932 domain-containing protein [Rhodospirillaceae bacterium]MDE0619843.1 DUF1932 domain-containing protein [Rhodospirillaceae bacterium]